MRPQLSVVIPVYGNWWLTRRALLVLDALRGSALPFETIVVDNASNDETPHAISAFPWVRYLHMEENRNFAGACNAGARTAQAPLTLFLNNDAYPLGDALAPIVAAFARDDVAIAGGALFFEDGVTQCAGFVVLPNAHWHYSYRNLPASLDGVVQARDALGVSGAAMAVRTEWFLGEGGFDEAYVNGFEDVDLCMRAREAGRTIRYVAGARFAHYEAASAGRFDREAENEVRFYRRWSARFESMPRTARGEVRGIAVRTAPDASALTKAGLDDLERALRALGHPLIRGAVSPWRRLDPRFRDGAALDWFVAADARAGVSVEQSGHLPVVRTCGAAELSVPWLPCAAPERAAALPMKPSLDVACATVAIAGLETLSLETKRDVAEALDVLRGQFPTLQTIDVSSEDVPLLGGRGPSVEVACVVQAGLTDPSAFGNVVLAQAQLPTIALGNALQNLLAPDVVLRTDLAGLRDTLARLLNEPQTRARYGRLVTADALRRFAPRRSAIRIVDLLCAAKFGLERPAAARTDTPLSP